MEPCGDLLVRKAFREELKDLDVVHVLPSLGVTDDQWQRNQRNRLWTVSAPPGRRGPNATAVRPVASPDFRMDVVFHSVAFDDSGISPSPEFAPARPAWLGPAAYSFDRDCPSRSRLMRSVGSGANNPHD